MKRVRTKRKWKDITKIKNDDEIGENQYKIERHRRENEL